MFKLLPRYNAAPIDDDRTHGLIVLNTVGATPLVVSGFSLSGVGAAAVAIVDGSGNQITSFGGGIQYIDAGLAVAHPTGTGIIFNNGGTYNFVSAAQPLPITGSITATNPSVGTTGAAIPSSATLLGASDGTNLQPLQVDASKNLKVLVENASLAVTGTFWQATQPISAASLPLPTGASTAAKQPALGVAGTPSADVLTVQGITSMTPLKVDGSGVTQPVSGTFWQATQPVSIASAVTVAQATAASLNATVVGTGTFAVQAAQSGAWNITNISGTVSLPTGAATEATLAKLAIAQATALGTNSGPLIQGSVTTAAPTYTTGNINPLSLTTSGALRVDLGATSANATAIKVDGSAVTQPVSGTVSITANSAVNVAQINGVTPLMGNGVTGTGSQRVTIASDNTVLPAVGAGATGSAVPANASYQGFDASTALPTAATAGNTVGGMSDKYGRQVVLPVTIRDLVGTQTTTITVATETTIVTAAASTFNDLIMLVVSNTSATAVRVDFRDTTAGSILFSLYLPAGDTRGFSLGGVPIPQTSVNTNWTAQVSSAVTDIRVYAVFAKNK